MANLSYLESPCERCGSKKRVAKRWKERIPTFTGSTVVEYSQIVCTNKVCQQAFEVELAKETKKRETLLREKLKRDKIRKTGISNHGTKVLDSKKKRKSRN